MYGKNNFLLEILEKIISAISNGYSNFLVLGFNSHTIRLLSELQKSGLLSYIKGIIENNNKLIGDSIFDISIFSYNDLTDITYDAIIVPYDQEKEEILNIFMNYEKQVTHIIMGGNENYSFSDRTFYDTLMSCSVKPKSGGYQNMLIHIFQSLKYLSTNQKFGDVVEFGVYQGGTTVFIAKTLEYFNNPSKIYGFDTFTGFPPPRSSLDLFYDTKYQYTDFNIVKKYCSPYNIELIKGDIFDTCEILKGKQLSFVFFDTDNYSATRKALEICYNQLMPGGILAFDHYYSPDWLQTLGERIAIKQVIDNYENILNLHETGIFLKIA